MSSSPAEEIPVHPHTPTSLYIRSYHMPAPSHKYTVKDLVGRSRIGLTLQNENAAWEDEVNGSALCVLKSQGLSRTKVLLTHHLYYQEIFLTCLMKISDLKVHVHSFSQEHGWLQKKVFVCLARSCARMSDPNRVSAAGAGSEWGWNS